MRRRRKLRRAAQWAGLVAFNAAIIIWAMSAWRTEVSLDGLQTGVVDTGTIESTLSATGTVKPGAEEIITSPIASRILAVYKRAGETVEEGEPLLLLDLTSVQTQYEQMSDENRMKELELERLRMCLTGSMMTTPAAGTPTVSGQEKALIEQALADCGGNVSRAAARLGLSRQALYRRIEKFGILI